MEGNEVRLPDVEISVLMYDIEVYRWSAWQDADIHEGLHVIAGIDSPSSGEVVRTLLQKALDQLQHASWKSLDELGADAGEEGAERPF